MSIRTIGRTVLAAASGYAATVLVVTLATPIAGLSGPPTTAVLAGDLFISFAGAIAAGYIAARLAAPGRRLAALGLLILIFLVVAVVLSRVFPDPSRPASFAPLVTLLSVIGAWAGAMIERAVHAAS